LFLLLCRHDQNEFADSHGTADRPERDVRRDAWLRTQGVKVMRYPASVVLKDPGGVAASILDAVRDGWDPDAP